MQIENLSFVVVAIVVGTRGISLNSLDFQTLPFFSLKIAHMPYPKKCCFPLIFGH